MFVNFLSYGANFKVISVSRCLLGPTVILMKRSGKLNERLGLTCWFCVPILVDLWLYCPGISSTVPELCENTVFVIFGSKKKHVICSLIIYHTYCTNETMFKLLISCVITKYSSVYAIILLQSQRVFINYGFCSIYTHSFVNLLNNFIKCFQFS